MPKTLTISQSEFKQGLHLLEDDSSAPFGTAREMLNVMITDRGGIAPRPGTTLLGDVNNSPHGTTGFYTFKKSLGSEEYPIKVYGLDSTSTIKAVMEYYHPDGGWQMLKDGFTRDEEFGFTTSLVNTANEDHVYFCNRYEPYQRWSGVVNQLSGALTGGETEIVVDSVLKTDVLESKTATASSATTLTIGSADWVSSQWIGFYVYIKAGTHEGKIRAINENSSTVITFDTLGTSPGNVAFEIRQTAFPSSGTVIYNGKTVAYTAIPEHNKLTVASAHAAPDNTPIAVVPQEFIGAPRGNRLENFLTRVFVGNIRSALSYDDGGALQGSTSAGSVFVSKIKDPSDFTFTATRVAGEGDILSTPYGGGSITDIKVFEDVVYIYKAEYIEAVSYSQDENDYAIRQPLKAGAGSVGRVIVGRDDHYFVNNDKQITSLGRVASRDITPRTENIGYYIKRLLDSGKYDKFSGIEYNNRILMAIKSSEDEPVNDVILVYNKQNGSFEGIWNLSAFGFSMYDGNLYYAESNGANVWEMFTDEKADIMGSDTVFPMTCKWQSNFFNVLPIKSNEQALVSLAVEGFIRSNSTITFQVFKEFGDSAVLEFDFGGDEEAFLGGSDIGTFFGASPLGKNAIGSIGDPLEDGRRRFDFIVYFPYIYAKELSVAVSSSGIRQDWEVNRISYGLRENISTRTSNTKVL